MSRPVDIEKLREWVDVQERNNWNPGPAASVRAALDELEALRAGSFTSAGLIRGYTAENERLRTENARLKAGTGDDGGPVAPRGRVKP